MTREIYLPPQDLTPDSSHAIMEDGVEKHRVKSATAVFDNGRRGETLLGCDCMQCFGYCLVNYDAVCRDDAEPIGEEDFYG